jgi:hypothetical protein
MQASRYVLNSTLKTEAVLVCPFEMMGKTYHITPRQECVVCWQQLRRLSTEFSHQSLHAKRPTSRDVIRMGQIFPPVSSVSLANQHSTIAPYSSVSVP